MKQHFLLLILAGTLLGMPFLPRPARGTTIAYDGKMLAADRQTTMGARKFLNKRFKIVDCGTHWVAGAGDVEVIELFITAWQQQGEAKARALTFKIPLNREAPDWLAMDKKTGQCTLYSMTVGGESITVQRVHAPFAIGSGGDYALGAMAHGATAVQAIKAVETLDLFTGGDIQCVEYEPELKLVK